MFDVDRFLLKIETQNPNPESDLDGYLTPIDTVNQSREIKLLIYIDQTNFSTPCLLKTIMWIIMNLDPEIDSFIKIWLTAITSMIFCHQIAARIPGGAARLLSILPIIYLFTILPTHLSSVLLGAPTMFYLVWLGNFKLLLFSFDIQGPLSSSSTPPLSLPHFVSIALLPIEMKETSSTKQITNPLLIYSKRKKAAAIFAIKCLILAAIVSSYKYRDFFHPYVILVLYILNVYLGEEIGLAISALPARAIPGLMEIEPQFKDPLLATSLQDFWGRRWNLPSSGILRPTVYRPIRRISERVLGKSWALSLAIVATFAVSGLMHQLLYYFLSRVRPTWEMTWFFVLHGFCVAAEVAAKKALAGRWRLHRMVSGPLTVAFVAVTAVWLFFSQIIRDGMERRAIDEYYVSFAATLKF
ncbi:long-chain-alcohol O-fatty-acyltransferase-like [Henckelia pumila]|uniref:long-chain-alcohol O-fatty-acyltransferase-like n=1 Tax=Henckelia pumila TaxID=405737 RepID=UPI003C6E7174